MSEDVVSSVIRQWAEVLPGVDLEPMEIVGRLYRCANLLHLSADAPLATSGLTRPEYDVLAALLRVGADVTPSRLARETFASGAAVTKRVRALEARGLVGRTVDDHDRRVARLSLTKAGRALVEQVTPRQLEYERTILADLDPGERTELSRLLSQLLVTLEGRFGGLAR